MAENSAPQWTGREEGMMEVDLDEMDVEVSARVADMRNKAAELSSALRFSFRMLLAKLPTRIREMRLSTLAEKYGGSVSSVMQEGVKVRERDFTDWVAETPLLSARKRPQSQLTTDDSGSESADSSATIGRSSLRSARKPSNLEDSVRHASTALRRATRHSSIRQRLLETPAAPISDTGNRRLTRSMRQSLMLAADDVAAINAPLCSAAVGASESHVLRARPAGEHSIQASAPSSDAGRSSSRPLPAGMALSTASGAVVDLSSSDAAKFLSRADLAQLKEMQERMAALIAAVDK